VLDGLANTIVAAEIATDLGDRDTRTLPIEDVELNMPATVIPTACSSNTNIDPSRPQFWAGGSLANVTNARGYRWASGFPVFSVVNTILPINSPVCTAATAEDDTTGGGVAGTNYWPRYGSGFLPPSSRHQGGCHVLMGDGAVKFFTDSIEAGDQTQTPVVLGGAAPAVPGAQSPYGLWGSLGTRANKETISEEL
ncbi:unnamed protein product, partial [Hapterophycus canaliculatus]